MKSEFTGNRIVSRRSRLSGRWGDTESIFIGKTAERSGISLINHYFQPKDNLL
jgi:hypothetical protein